MQILHSGPDCTIPRITRFTRLISLYVFAMSNCLCCLNCLSNDYQVLAGIVKSLPSIFLNFALKRNRRGDQKEPASAKVDQLNLFTGE